MFVWTCPHTGCTMIGTHAPEGVPHAPAPEDARPDEVWLNPETGAAEPTPERPSQGHVFDAPTGTWIDAAPPRDGDRVAELRARRNHLLSACDFTMLEDSPYDRQAWKIYRQQLRDMTFEGDVIWPEPPAEQGTPA